MKQEITEHVLRPIIFGNGTLHEASVPHKMQYLKWTPKKELAVLSEAGRANEEEELWLHEFGFTTKVYGREDERKARVQVFVSSRYKELLPEDERNFAISDFIKVNSCWLFSYAVRTP